jgi:hypothetical protein
VEQHVNAMTQAAARALGCGGRHADD